MLCESLSPIDMNDIRTPVAVFNRFLTEQEYIQRFVDFLESRTAIKDVHLHQIAMTLQKYDLPPIPVRREWYGRLAVCSPEDVASISEAIGKIGPRLEQVIESAREIVEQLKEPVDLHKIDVISLIGEWIQYFIGVLEYDDSPEAVRRAVEDARRQQEIALHEDEEAEILSDGDIDYAMRSAQFIFAWRRLDELTNLRESLSELDLALRISTPKAEVNVLRQGFLLLMTALDAAVFDLVRIALQKDFFRLIGVFGQKQKLALEDFRRYEDFDAFREDLVEGQLKRFYLKDLLFILRDLGVSLVDPNAGDRFIGLIELVLRRNVHIHNRGAIDEHYLEKDERGKPRYNIYNFRLGDVAQIDQNYWGRANRLCRNCVAQITAWVENNG